MEMIQYNDLLRREGGTGVKPAKNECVHFNLNNSSILFSFPTTPYSALNQINSYYSSEKNLLPKLLNELFSEWLFHELVGILEMLT